METTKAREKMKRNPNATNEPLIERYDPIINVYWGSGVILHHLAVITSVPADTWGKIQPSRQKCACWRRSKVT
jgi:hypothetical protein